MLILSLKISVRNTRERNASGFGDSSLGKDSLGYPMRSLSGKRQVGTTGSWEPLQYNWKWKKMTGSTGSTHLPAFACEPYLSPSSESSYPSKQLIHSACIYPISSVKPNPFQANSSITRTFWLLRSDQPGRLLYPPLANPGVCLPITDTVWSLHGGSNQQ